MTRPEITICAALAGMAVASQAVAASSTLLQTVNLNELSPSAEGGEATLSRLPNAKHGRCEITVEHFGETGRQTYRFVFADKLNYAVRRDYRYSLPISVTSNPKMTLTNQVLLASPQGRATLPKKFEFYRKMFDPAKLKYCVGGNRR
jgi:hypothetical protein